jgi:NTE family protein
MLPVVRAAAILLLCVFCTVLEGCAGTRIENAPLRTGQANQERRSLEPLSADRPTILMTFSGGGSRATALAASVLHEMAGTTYRSAGGVVPLTMDVKAVSSVSGGSVTAAWFGLNRDPDHPDGRLAELRSRFLVQDNMRELELDAVDPVTWLRLAFSGFTRIEALEDLFTSTLFDHQPMSVLNQPGRPFIILNTTDMAGGEAFAFVPRRLDDVCSDYDRLPISTAVAASAAFPVLLSPVSFRDFSQNCAGQLRSGEWFKVDLSNPYTPIENLSQYRDARYTNDLRHGQNTFRDIEYLYFLDGGLADNLGIKSLRSALIEPYGDVGVLRAINEGRIRKLVVIVVNARSDPPNGLYQQNTTPGVISAIQAVTSVPIDANTANSQLGLTQLLTEIAQAVGEAQDARFKGLQVYGITVDFDQIPVDTAAGRALRDTVKNIPTSWTLSSEQLLAIDNSARLLLQRDPCYRALLSDLGARPPASYPSPVLPRSACATLINVPPPPCSA